MLKFGKTEIAKKKRLYAGKRSIKNWDVNTDNIVISNLPKTKFNF